MTMSFVKFPALIFRNEVAFVLTKSLPKNASTLTADLCGHSRKLAAERYHTSVVKPIYFKRSWPFHISGKLTNYRKQSNLTIYNARASMHTTVFPAADNPAKMYERKVSISQPSIRDPDQILSFDVAVLDTFPDDVNQDRPTVVAVHGMPGSGHDFLSLGQKLKEKGIRLVAPTCLGLPPSTLDPMHLQDVDFTTTGRTKSLQNILTAMNIHRVDMLLGHSGGAWTVYEAGSQWSNVHSFLLVNSAGAEPNRHLRPFFLLQVVAKAVYWPLSRKIFQPLLHHYYKLYLGFKEVPADDGNFSLVVTQQYTTKQQFENVPKNAKNISGKQTPILFVYTLNDRLVEPSIYKTMAYDLLGIPVDNSVLYSNDKKPSRDPLFVPEGRLARCLVFARGGHIAYLAHEAEVVSQIENVLSHIRAKETDDMKEGQKIKNVSKL